MTVVTRPSERWAAEAPGAGFTHLDFFRGPANPVGAARLAGVLRRERIDVVHAHKGGGRTLTLLARGLGRHPPLVVNRGVSFPMTPASRWLDGSRLVARIVAVCQAIKDDLVHQGLPRAKIEVVYSGTDTAWFDPARASGAGIRQELAPPATPRDPDRRAEPNDDVLRAFGWVHEWPYARLLLVGARPRSAPSRRRSEPRLGDAVRTGLSRRRPRDTRRLGRVGRRLVRRVGYWNLRESLAMEMVVATRAMATRSSSATRHGLLVPPRDPEALAQAVLRLLSTRPGLGCRTRPPACRRRFLDTGQGGTAREPVRAPGGPGSGPADRLSVGRGSRRAACGPNAPAA